MRFDLTDMRLFLTVVEHGSLTQGAQAMNLALASVSERISGMESALGAPLLERTRRGIRPTAAGEALIRHARLILGNVEQMRGELRAYATGLKGRVGLLSNTAALAAFVPQQLRRFLAAYPDLSVDLDERPSNEIVLAIAEGRADVGIVADIADLAMLQTHLIAQDQLMVVAGKDHRIASQERVAFADIVDEAFVGIKDTALEIHLAERASRLGRQINYRVQLRNVEQVGMFVEAGIGLAILSKAFVGELRRPGLAVLPILDPWASRQLHLCVRDFAALTPQAGLLVQHLLDAGTSPDGKPA
ncbi:MULTISPECIES: LysR family transcriptional regulator [Paraburkholderia]|uniref:DNA-binding transcriptional regulator, LysR family n=1 Tax=Paraburkholderia megapolitana TaxID=420953 RepID=A0A1I3KKG9_9BURK|nr:MULTISPECIES: LysR family transcriptional regulator [Paraburkholderia]MCX4163528.1 LysR family transcriptional regulator [Paraburkholderia megapolitana]MDN7159023.1 LysR family transcriptional regulator [Paraburkholderia sp. CHISQ3]MDQ6496070.1 LysR family transcriptional regulator [Paraburkholderia megapolitana]QDQ80373.1 LysR family transcriptional regulator [Paraburkholderia megapolitana]SFI72884.1 DNA-binding transcriptional regulator, LysR family [Paraburkholderia megapolitana]